MTIQSMQSMFLAVFMCFSPYLGIGCAGGGGGSPKGLVHNVLVHFFSLRSSKIEVSEEADYFDIVTTKK